MILENNYCKSRSPGELIEWIPYDEFTDIVHTADDKNNALWLKGCICNWDKGKLSWIREVKKVILVNFWYYDIDLFMVLARKLHKCYGISKDPTSHGYILVFDYKDYNKSLCIKCQALSYFFDWCEGCKLNHFQLNYGEFSSGNDEIDMILENNYCKSRSPGELIEWIPYDEFTNIVHTADDKNNALWLKGCICNWDKELYGAIWLNGCVCYWNSNNPNWDRIKNLKVILVNSEDLGHIFKILIEGKYVYQLYGITKNLITLNYLLIFEYSTDFLKLLNKPKDCQIIGISKNEKYKYNLVTYLDNYSHFLYPNCKLEKPSFFNWCNNCKLNQFKLNYGEFLSGNDEIDNILKDNYCKSNNISEFIEWIPYNLFINITYIDQGGFSEVYSALWLNNNIYEWDHIKLEWKRRSGYKNVALKVLKSSYNVSGFLQEVQSYYKIGFSHKITKLYGISKDPSTQDYVLVLEYVNHGSLRKFLDKYNKYLITTYKIQILKNIAEGLKEIHSKNVIHQDIHSGNILTKDFDRVKISDLGLSKFVSHDEKEEIVYKVYGNLPYIAPEVLRGKQYTQKADIYAFGIIINEVFTGERPFHDVIDDKLKLMIDICKNRLRPKISKNTPKPLVHLLNKCWDETPLNRLTADEIIQKLNHFETDDIIFEELRNYNNEILKQYSESTSKLGYLKTLYNSELHLTKSIKFKESSQSELLDCCI
ncbi:kinase-like domain-containing protein [Rhizophagus diaphanus]|nr:kinase-like domain-containing protein [Rhizophagus diaphanus] [Rhizophagus sp. MUCL 43196]